MDAVLKERQLTPSQQEEIELRESHPEKFEPEFDSDFHFKVNKESSNLKDRASIYRPLTREETAKLLAASRAVYKPEPLPPTNLNYPTYTKEQVAELLKNHWSYKDRNKSLKKEKDWDSLKTTESDIKTESITKPSKSSKDSKNLDTKTRKLKRT